MARIEEPRLKADLKAGQLGRAYFLFGEEDYLTRLYADKLAGAALGEGDRDMNLTKLSGCPDVNELSDIVDTLPFFAERKCVVIADLDPDEMDTPSANALAKLIEGLPDTAVLIICEYSVEIDPKKPKAKVKKIMDAVDKAGFVCEMKYMTPARVGAMAQKKAARAGCALSAEDGVYLAELCGCSLTRVSNEMGKLCGYKGSGEITRADIDALTARITDTGVYTLAAELFAGHNDAAFQILDDLFAQQEDPVVIMAALSGHFVDLYRAKLGQNARLNSDKTAAAFGYPPKRAFVMRKAFGLVRGLTERYLAECIDVLYRANIMLNSSHISRRTILEEALAQISVLREREQAEKNAPDTAD